MQATDARVTYPGPNVRLARILGGTQKQAKRSFRAIYVKEQNARDAMNTLLGRRPSPIGTDAVDAAFGAEPPVVPPLMFAVEGAPPLRATRCLTIVF